MTVTVPNRSWMAAGGPSAAAAATGSSSTTRSRSFPGSRPSLRSRTAPPTRCTPGRSANAASPGRAGARGSRASAAATPRACQPAATARSGAVGHALGARVRGAVRAAVHRAAGLDAVADDLAAAVGAGRRERVDRALEGVEGAARAAGDRDLHRLVVVVAADVAGSHGPAATPGSYRANRDPGGGEVRARLRHGVGAVVEDRRAEDGVGARADALDEVVERARSARGDDRHPHRPG